MVRGRSLCVGWLAVVLSWGCAGDDTPPRDPAGTPPPPRSEQAHGWQRVREADGVVVERERVPGNDRLIAMRGEGEIQAPLRAVAAVMIDLDRAPTWVDRVVKARVLDQPSDKELSTYWHVAAPGNVLDRDFVVRVAIDYAPPERIRFSLVSHAPPRAPASRHVRGRVQQSFFELTALDRGRTRVRCEIRIDPGEPLDEPLLNHLVRTWIVKSLGQLSALASQPGAFRNSAEIAELLTRQGFGDEPKP